jgi:N-acyl-D-amino-acid deacylase
LFREIVNNLWLLALLLGLQLSGEVCAEDLVIVNALIVDGSGDPAVLGDIRVSNGKITVVGDVNAEMGDRIVDADGLVLAPGFIDTHSHMDIDLKSGSDALAALSQGITTVIVGQDGDSSMTAASLEAFVTAKPVSINLATYTGHGGLRDQVMGDDFKRTATKDEIRKMSLLLRQDLKEGSLGLSTGLEYDPGIYSSTAEIIALAGVAADAGGRYISHVRSEDRALFEAVEEVITIARETGIAVQISHIKLARIGLWGHASDLLKRLDQARRQGIDITADIYPYTYWQSSLTVLLPERDFADIEAAQYALDELAKPEGLTLATFAPDPSLIGLTIADIARLRDQTEAVTYLQLIAEAYSDPTSLVEYPESVIGVSMTDADIAALAQWPHANLCSDGSASGGHPRGWGAFPRAIRLFVRESSLLTLPEMIHKMTALSAQHVGLAGRGLIRPGYAADLVLFDPLLMTDRSTMADPGLMSEGVSRVWVNGQLVFADRQVSVNRPGRFLVRPTGTKDRQAW